MTTPGQAVSLLLALVVVATTGMLAHSRDSSTAALELSSEPPPSPGDRIEILGRVSGEGRVTIVLRIDDAASRDYATRVNLERELPPGPMSWQVVIGGLGTPSGRTLDLTRLKRILVFKAAGTADVDIASVRLVRPAALPGGAKGYAFGHVLGALPSGFERVTLGDPRLEGGTPSIVRRPLPDPLSANGMRGLRRVRLPWPEGRARVTIWSEDPGEWELLPHPLARRISIGRHPVVDESFTAEEWVRHRYLAGGMEEHDPTSDAWQAFGARRAKPRSVEVDVGSEGIVVDLEGATPDARFLSAVLVAPADGGDAAELVEAERARWYRDNWPVLRRELEGDRGDIARITLGDAAAVVDRPMRLRVAPRSGGRLRARIEHLAPRERVSVALRSPPEIIGNLTTHIWQARQRLDRRRAQESFLTLSDHALHPATEIGPVPGSDHRLLEIWIEVGAGMPVGLHPLVLSFRKGRREQTVPVVLEVVDVELRHARKPAGVYLDESPHLTWFEPLKPMRARQVACDAHFVATLGLTGSAPALSTPLGVGEEEFMLDLQRAHEAGLADPPLAYAPAKRVMAALGIRKGALQLAAMDEAVRKRGLPRPVWSIADEPSNPSASENWRAWLEAIRSLPGSPIVTAGHLNSPRDALIAPRFDVALVNEGFGLDVDTLATASRSVSQVWLYNTGAPRLTAGFWLWRTAARRYVQWHARMPTADPFDPIDGREGDEQMLLPSLQPCPTTPPIHRDLLELAEGVVDQRWLDWLERRGGEEARRLAQSLAHRVGSLWRPATRLSQPELHVLRESIIDLAMERVDRP